MRIHEKNLPFNNNQHLGIVNFIPLFNFCRCLKLSKIDANSLNKQMHGNLFHDLVEIGLTSMETVYLSYKKSFLRCS